MEPDLNALKKLLGNRAREIDKIVEGTGYLPKTVSGVITFLLDNEANLDLLSAKQRVTYDRFVKPLLESRRR